MRRNSSSSVVIQPRPREGAPLGSEEGMPETRETWLDIEAQKMTSARETETENDRTRISMLIS